MVKKSAPEQSTQSLRSLERSERFFLLGLLVVLAVLYNYTNIFGTNWTLHPDDHEYLVLGKHLAETGSLAIPATAFPAVDFPAVFTPNGAHFVGDQIVPLRAYGMYYLVAATGAHQTFVFLVVPVIALIGVVVLYFLMRDLFGKDAAMISTLLATTSFPIVYWSNMLYPNYPTVVFFLLGVYLLQRALRTRTASWWGYVGAALAFAASVWLRYEMLFMVLWMLLPIIVFAFARRIQWAKLIVAVTLFFLALSPIFWLNQRYYGSPFVSPYTIESPGKQTTSGGEKAVDTAEEARSIGFEQGAQNIFARFFNQTIHPDAELLRRNGGRWILGLYPTLTVLCVIGLGILIRSWRREHAFVLALFLAAALWAYSNAGGILWGYNTNWVGTTYIRYSLLFYVVMAMLSGVVYDRFRRAFPRRFVMSATLIFLILFGLRTVELSAGEFGLFMTTEKKGEYEQLNERIQRLPERSIVLTVLEGKYLVGRTVYNPSQLPTDTQRVDMRTDVDRFLRSGYAVYALENPAHTKTYLGLRNFFTHDRQFVYTSLPAKGNEFGIIELAPIATRY